MLYKYSRCTFAYFNNKFCIIFWWLIANSLWLIADGEKSIECVFVDCLILEELLGKETLRYSLTSF